MFVHTVLKGLAVEQNKLEAVHAETVIFEVEQPSQLGQTLEATIPTARLKHAVAARAACKESIKDDAAETVDLVQQAQMQSQLVDRRPLLSFENCPCQQHHR